eukprot:TRINITY_DN1819_c0_g1_i2.p2 TRINITY_DN1819_c0_g1~~TRINITY_DN1819_c0_g1_i2.p2  ORF type:complete len:195 (-),score=42.28 TRINITY_DN1819_c0_g1_i2:118-621(-)
MQLSLAAASLALLHGALAAVKVKRDSPSDVAAEVARQTAQNIHISDDFKGMEDTDVQAEKRIKANKDLSALQLGQSAPAVKDPCGGITCGPLNCPAGFVATKTEGHCCSYCVNPDIKLEVAVTGATGSSGGKPSTFCDKVWCFPTLCQKPLVTATTTNGQCCDKCPA